MSAAEPSRAVPPVDTSPATTIREAGPTVDDLLLARSGLPYSAGVGAGAADGLRAGITGGRTAWSESFSVVLAQPLSAAEARQCGSPDLEAVSDSEQRRAWRFLVKRSTC